MLTAGWTYVSCCLIGEGTCRIFYRQSWLLCHSTLQYSWDSQWFFHLPSLNRFLGIAIVDTVPNSREYLLEPLISRDRSTTKSFHNIQCTITLHFQFVASYPEILKSKLPVISSFHMVSASFFHDLLQTFHVVSQKFSSSMNISNLSLISHYREEVESHFHLLFPSHVYSLYQCLYYDFKFYYPFHISS